MVNLKMVPQENTNYTQLLKKLKYFSVANLHHFDADLDPA
jgi:hypothetical protein